MPAGVTWGKYLTVTGAALLSMFAGSQFVHQFYRPLDDLDELVQKEVERRLSARQAVFTPDMSQHRHSSNHS